MLTRTPMSFFCYLYMLSRYHEKYDSAIETGLHMRKSVSIVHRFPVHDDLLGE